MEPAFFFFFKLKQLYTLIRLGPNDLTKTQWSFIFSF